MRFHLWAFLVVASALAVAAYLAISDAREQTAFLERLAEGIERVQAVPPETERAIRKSIQSVRRNSVRLDGSLDARQRRAVARIEAKLASVSLASPVKDEVDLSTGDHTASAGLK